MYRILLLLHYVCFLISPNRHIIEKDLKRRQLYHPSFTQSTFKMLSHALWNEPEYRNQFYYRLGKWTRRILNVLLPSLQNIDLSNSYIDEGLVIIHGYNIVINPLVRIGKNCTMLHEVTIGAIKGGIPTIGDNVFIGCGAKILGG